MIICDHRKFVFIHIPKCAGTTVLMSLKDLDDFHRPASRRLMHEKYGELNLDHLTLGQLWECFPTEFKKVCEYQSYAIIRDPRQRFVSALLHYLKSHKNIEASHISLGKVRDHAFEVCDRLPKDEDQIEFTFFRRQCAFVFLEGRQIVKNLYTIEDLRGFSAAMLGRHAVEVDVNMRYNQRRLAPIGAAELLRIIARPFYSRLFRGPRREWLKVVIKPMVTRAPSPLYREILETAEIADFVSRHYVDDFALYERLSGNLGATKTPAAAGAGR